MQLENDLHAQQLIVTREREEQKRKDDISRAAVMATVVNSNMNVLQIEADNNNVGSRVGDAFHEAIEQIGNNFDIELRATADALDNEVLTDDIDSEDEEEDEEENIVVNTKRIRKSNVMVGSV